MTLATLASERVKEVAIFKCFNNVVQTQPIEAYVAKHLNVFCSCFRTPEQCPSVVSLLSESYNPHVRYGAAMALGIACAGTGLKVRHDKTLKTPQKTILCNKMCSL